MAGREMELRLLGPVEVVVDGRVLDPGPPQQRLVLAALAAEAGRPVGIDSLIDRVWDQPPEQPRRALQVYISRIRRLLATLERTKQAPVLVVRRSGGYLLDLDPNRVDAHRFRRLIQLARDQECPEAKRTALLEQALELWRGLPLSDLPGQWAERVRQGWQQQYLDAMAAWALACHRVGDPGAVLPRLGELVGEHPLMESLAATYMQVLYAAGRPADALNHYTAIRHRLAEELGTDPGPELQQLHRQILSADPTLTPPAAALARQTPRQLPAPPQMFTGRTDELAMLDEIHDTSTVVITAIDGMAGVGKTALAVHAAHRIADRYPDGQLFTDLHGYTQGVAPIQPGEALDRMLRALGVTGQQIPASLDERAALYRTRLADQRMLIVLDNAAAEAQVAPLLPGAPGCLVLVTSRRRLSGLDHTRTLLLETLPVPDAVTLFTRTVGEGRLTDTPPGLLVELAQLCGRLPLAIRIAAARLRSHPTWPPSHLVERLRRQQHRLGELEAGQRSVIAALDLSHQHLSADQQQAYRRLGLHPGPDIDVFAAAALLDSTVLHASRMLDQLLDAHLLQERAPGRYRFHDLTRAHAAHIAARDQTESTGPRALNRLLDYYRHSAALAMDAAYPYEREHRPPVPPARTPGPDLSAPAPALGWLDAELPNLLSTARYAIEHGRPEHVLHLSTVLHRHLRSRARYHDAETLHRQALTTARAKGHRPGELDALTGLGHIHRLHGRYAQAADHYQQALQISQAIGHRAGELDALTGLGHIHRLHGRYAQAADHCQQALQISQAIGHRAGELDALTGLGGIHRAQGRYAQAADHCQQALQISQAIGYRHGELDALNGLGHLHWVRGQPAQAADHYQQALQIARTTGHRHGELTALAGLGDIHRLQGRYAQAAGHFQQLLDLAQESCNRNYEFEARQGLGRLRHATGDPDTALAHHDRALALADELGQPLDQARAHDGLAHAHHALNQHERAGKHWQLALDILTGLGVDHTDEEEATVAAIRAHLADLDQQQTR